MSPPDLEPVFNRTGGNIFQGAMTPGHLFAFRRVPRYARDQLAGIRGLYPTPREAKKAPFAAPFSL